MNRARVHWAIAASAKTSRLIKKLPHEGNNWGERRGEGGAWKHRLNKSCTNSA